MGHPPMRLTRLLPMIIMALSFSLTGYVFAQDATHTAQTHANSAEQDLEETAGQIGEAVEPHGETDMHDGTHAEHPERTLIPSLKDPTTYYEAAYTIVVFVLFFVLLSVFVWPKILASLQAREEKVRGDLKHAEDAAKDASATLAEYKQQLAEAQKQAQQIVEDSRQSAQQVTNQLKDQAQAEITQIKERAQADIAVAKEQAVAEIYDQAGTLATQVAGQILRREINAGDQATLIRESIDKLRGAEQN